MKPLRYALGILFAFCLMIILLITSVEAVAYWTPGYYEKEYTKYGVAEDVNMEMDDLLDVTREMMAYLRGNREDLHVTTVVGGQTREFFNEREIAHMEDVQGLFLAALTIRRICFALAAACIILLVVLKSRLRQILPRSICAGTGLFFTLVCILTAVISTDFTKYFVKFHEIFFDNDLWILDPRTDLLINIVPEPFFVDTAARIGLTFGISVLMIFLICLFLLCKRKKRAGFLILFLSCSMALGSSPSTVLAAPEWPDNIAIEAEGGIVMDKDTGTVLYGKNMHTPYFPASITKILTALIVLQHCDLDETVTFSHNAVYNVEANSSSAGLDVGDELSVRDCLYAMLLKSANEAANALAEHVSGTTEDFSVLMNETAASLGCVDSNFVNPSGLNNPEHYTSAYDMALIGKAALENETFVTINSSLYYDLPVTKRNPEGARVYPGHKMIKKNLAEYYHGAFGGKTGYTSLAGNTLVTFAQKNDMTLITVILNGHQTHYSDTRKLLNFGFDNFLPVIAADYDPTYTTIENDMTIAGLSGSDLASLGLDRTSKVVLPKNTDFSSVTSSISYDITDDDPAGSIAKVQYSYGEREIGHAYLNINRTEVKAQAIPSTTLAEIADITLESTEAPTGEPLAKKEAFRIPAVVWTILTVLLVLTLLIGGIILWKMRQEKLEQQRRANRRERRMQRLKEGGVSAAEFDLLMEQKRSSYTVTKHDWRRSKHNRFNRFKK